MSKLASKITEDKNGKGLWLVINSDGNRDFDKSADEFALPRDNDVAGGVAYAVLPEEIEAIRYACNDYLRGKDVDSIDITWCVDDVFTLMYDEEQENYTEEDYETAREVLQFVYNNHDANIGVNWDTLQWALDKVQSR